MNTQDLSGAKNQAQVIKRIAVRLKKYGLRKKDSPIVEFADHLETEANYLCEYLGVE